MASLFEAYITNLGKYNEGELVGETLEFPTSPQEVQALLKHIGVDGIRYEEFFITSFDGDVLGLYDYLGEYENLDELNHLACLLSELDQGELEKFEAVLHTGAHTSSVADIINLTQNLDCFEFYPDIENEEDLGRYWAEDLPIPERHTAGTFPSTRAATWPQAAMWFRPAETLGNIITAPRTSPPNIRFSPIPSFLSESRWPPTRR